MKTPYKCSVVDVVLLSFLKQIARRVADHFHLKYRSVSIMTHTDESYNTNTMGYCIDRHIVIKLTYKGRYYPVEELVDTLAHEMAHLLDPEDVPEHTAEWRSRYHKYKRWVNRKVISECSLLPPELPI